MSIHRRETTTKGTVYVVRWHDPRPRERHIREAERCRRLRAQGRHEVDTGTYRDPDSRRSRSTRWYKRWWQLSKVRTALDTIAQYENIAKNHRLSPTSAACGWPGLRRIDFEEWCGELGQGSRRLRDAHGTDDRLHGHGVRFARGVVTAKPHDQAEGGLRLDSGEASAHGQADRGTRRRPPPIVTGRSPSCSRTAVCVLPRPSGCAVATLTTSASSLWKEA